MTWNQLGCHAKPSGLLDVNGDYARRSDHRLMIPTSPDPMELIERFANYEPPIGDKWIELEKSLWTGFFWGAHPNEI